MSDIELKEGYSIQIVYTARVVGFDRHYVEIEDRTRCEIYI
jgi:hypothetical protein